MLTSRPLCTVHAKMGTILDGQLNVRKPWGISFILESGASDNGLGAVLCHVQSGKERAIAYAARALSKAERNYSTNGRNMLVLVLATEHLETFLYGQHCLARTDHSALQWLRNKSCSKINQEFLFVKKVARKNKNFFGSNA